MTFYVYIYIYIYIYIEYAPYIFTKFNYTFLIKCSYRQQCIFDYYFIRILSPITPQAFCFGFGRTGNSKHLQRAHGSENVEGSDRLQTGEVLGRQRQSNQQGLSCTVLYG